MRKKASRMKKAIKWIVVAVVLIGIGFWIYNARFKAEADAKPTYERVKVERMDLRTTVESTGEIQPRNRLDVKPPIAGRLEALLVDDGDPVEKGQILGWVSSTERATLLDAALATSEEELEYWEELYKPTPLISPIKGAVIARNFEPGQSINANDAVVVIADDLIVVANLDETDIGQVKLEQKVKAYLEAYPETKFDCVVEKIAYDARTVSNVTMYDVDVRAEALPDFARSGMTANLEFILEERSGILAVDSSAIMEIVQPEGDGVGTPDSKPEEQQRPSRETMAAKMRERCMSEAEIKKRIEGFNKRMGEKGREKPQPSKRGGMAEVFVDSGDPEAPARKTIRIGISDGLNTEILEGLEEGDEVLIEQIMTGQRKAAGSPFMPKRSR